MNITFDRIRGLLNPEHFAAIDIIAIGCGSGNSTVLAELAKNGGQRFVLYDHDQLDNTNLVRHVLGRRELGRNKAEAMADWLRDRNENVTVDVRPLRFQEDYKGLEERLQSSSKKIVLCGVDKHVDRLALNQLCVENETPYVVGMVFHRGTWGMAMRYRPRIGGCYACCERFTEKNRLAPLHEAGMAPTGHSDEEIYGSGVERLVKNPGLSLDIGFVAFIVARLALDAMLDIAGTSYTDRKPLAGNLLAFCNYPTEENGFRKTFTSQHLFLSPQFDCDICHNGNMAVSSNEAVSQS